MRPDKAWFSERVRENEASMYALAMSYMKQEADALDCIQQSILKAYEHLDGLKDPEKFRSWMFGILVNCCRDELRRRKRFRVVEPEEGAEPSVPDASEAADTKTVLWNALSRLDDPYRTVLLLFYYEDLSTADIADVTGAGQSAVRKQLERGRALLRDELTKEGFSYEE